VSTNHIRGADQDEIREEAMVFYYNLKTAVFQSGADFAFMDGYRYQLKAPAREAGNDVLIPVEDLCRIYSPDMTMQAEDERITLTMHGTAVTLTVGSDRVQIEFTPNRLSTPCQEIDGIVYVPVAQLMNYAFDKHVRSSKDMNPIFISCEERGTHRFGACNKKNVTVSVSDDADYELDTAIYRSFDVLKRGKKYGEQYRTYWMDGPKKVIPYISYIPTKYDPEKPSKLVVFLHGGSRYEGERYALTFGGIRLQQACEKYNYILLCTNACTLLSAYGNMFDEQIAHASPEEIAYYQWGDESVMQAIDMMKAEYNIDEDHIYLMGNSMGGGGTFYLPTVHQGMFRALAPGAGSLVVMRPKNLDALKGMPIIIPAGTEDDFGFDNILLTRDILKDVGAEVEMAIVGGGKHLSAWAEVIDEIFEFFEKHA